MKKIILIADEALIEPACLLAEAPNKSLNILFRERLAEFAFRDGSGVADMKR